MTSAQRELVKTHGLPGEFAAAVNRAADQQLLTTAEASKAIADYASEFATAGEVDSWRREQRKFNCAGRSEVQR